MTDNILPTIDFAAVIAEILEDYAPESGVIHTLTDQQVNDLFTDLVAGCEDAYEDASERAEEAIEEVYEQEVGLDPYDLPADDDELLSEESFHTSEVVQGAIADMKQQNIHI